MVLMVLDISVKSAVMSLEVDTVIIQLVATSGMLPIITASLMALYDFLSKASYIPVMHLAL